MREFPFRDYGRSNVWYVNTGLYYWRSTMSSTIDDRIAVEPVAIRAWSENRTVYIELHDDRVISFPAHKFTRLASASQEQLAAVRIRAQGCALRWDDIDEDISVDGIVRGLFESD
jgi:hypothetical protein